MSARIHANLGYIENDRASFLFAPPARSRGACDSPCDSQLSNALRPSRRFRACADVRVSCGFGVDAAGRRHVRHFGRSDRRFFLSNMPTRSITLHSKAMASRMTVVRLGTLRDCEEIARAVEKRK